MKKIAIFHPSNDLYGSDRIIASVCIGLSENNYHVDLYIPNRNGLLEDYLKDRNKQINIQKLRNYPLIQRKIFTPNGIIMFLLTMSKFIKYKFSDYDVFYINTLSNSFFTLLLKRYKKPIFTHVHEILEKPIIIKCICHYLVYKYSSKIICVSYAVKDNFSKIQKTKIIVIHNGITGLKIIDKKQINKKVNYCLLGRFMPEKGQWFLLETLNTMERNILEKMHFILVGSAPPKRINAKHELLAIIKKYNLENYITVMDFQEDITESMNNADVCLIPSIMKDPFPTTVLEAMSIGKPVIVTNTGGAVEMVKDGETGFVIGANDTDSFKEKLLFFANNINEIKRMGAKGKGIFELNFTLQPFVSNIISTINN